jgi:hypothetical protein
VDTAAVDKMEVAAADKDLNLAADYLGTDLQDMDFLDRGHRDKVPVCRPDLALVLNTHYLFAQLKRWLELKLPVFSSTYYFLP